MEQSKCHLMEEEVPVLSILRRFRQEGCKFKASLNYNIDHIFKKGGREGDLVHKNCFQKKRNPFFVTQEDEEKRQGARGVLRANSLSVPSHGGKISWK